MKLKSVTSLLHLDRLAPDRLMFYEFLDLLASVDNIETVKKELPPKKEALGPVGSSKLYELCDFVDELSTEDQRYHRYLDHKYEDSRRVIAVEESENDASIWKCSIPAQWVVPPLANQEIRKEMSEKNHAQSELLKLHLDSSDSEVKRRGFSIPCTCDAKLMSDIQKENEEKAQSRISSTKQTSPTRSKVQVRRMEPIVSKKDLDDTAQKIESMQWDIATHSQTHKKKMEAAYSKK